MNVKLCKLCGKNKCFKKGGTRTLSSICRPCNKRPWVKFKKAHCEFCGFVPVHHAQLDVDHVDGDKANNDPTNLRTLCANCHRLKTILSRDHLERDDEVADPQIPLC